MLERRSLAWLAAGLLGGVVGGLVAGLLRAPRVPQVSQLPRVSR